MSFARLASISRRRRGSKPLANQPTWGISRVGSPCVRLPVAGHPFGAPALGTVFRRICYRWRMRQYLTLLLVALIGQPALAENARAPNPEKIRSCFQQQTLAICTKPCTTWHSLSQISAIHSTSVSLIAESKILASTAKARLRPPAPEHVSWRLSEFISREPLPLWLPVWIIAPPSCWLSRSDPRDKSQANPL